MQRQPSYDVAFKLIPTTQNSCEYQFTEALKDGRTPTARRARPSRACYNVRVRKVVFAIRHGRAWFHLAHLGCSEFSPLRTPKIVHRHFCVCSLAESLPHEGTVRGVREILCFIESKENCL